MNFDETFSTNIRWRNVGVVYMNEYTM